MARVRAPKEQVEIHRIDKAKLLAPVVNLLLERRTMNEEMCNSFFFIATQLTARMRSKMSAKSMRVQHRAAQRQTKSKASYLRRFIKMREGGRGSKVEAKNERAKQMTAIWS